ncbi:MAG: hypothetical protein H6Q90_299 [Deltaproteobacteria bacterium]|nr:hypothetical protein [Deltaproteobacteria bacterium]
MSHDAAVSDLPPCGLYRTVSPIAEIAAGRLVYFHNHGNPGPGVYFPESWTGNRAHFSPQGTTLPVGFDPKALLPLPAEGFYRVTKSFVCCPKKCVTFEPESFVQLGYNGAGAPLLFVPELSAGVITVPERGTPIDDIAFANLVLLRINERAASPQGSPITFPRGILVH